MLHDPRWYARWRVRSSARAKRGRHQCPVQSPEKCASLDHHHISELKALGHLEHWERHLYPSNITLCVQPAISKLWREFVFPAIRPVSLFRYHLGRKLGWRELQRNATCHKTPLVLHHESRFAWNTLEDIRSQRQLMAGPGHLPLCSGRLKECPGHRSKWVEPHAIRTLPRNTLSSGLPVQDSFAKTTFLYEDACSGQNLWGHYHIAPGK